MGVFKLMLTNMVTRTLSKPGLLYPIWCLLGVVLTGQYFNLTQGGPFFVDELTLSDRQIIESLTGTKPLLLFYGKVFKPGMQGAAPAHFAGIVDEFSEAELIEKGFAKIDRETQPRSRAPMGFPFFGVFIHAATYYEKIVSNGGIAVMVSPWQDDKYIMLFTSSYKFFQNR